MEEIPEPILWWKDAKNAKVKIVIFLVACEFERKLCRPRLKVQWVNNRYSDAVTFYFEMVLGEYFTHYHGTVSWILKIIVIIIRTLVKLFWIFPRMTWYKQDYISETQRDIIANNQQYNNRFNYAVSVYVCHTHVLSKHRGHGQVTALINISLLLEQLHQDLQVHPTYLHSTQPVRAVPEGSQLLLCMSAYITGNSSLPRWLAQISCFSLFLKSPPSHQSPQLYPCLECCHWPPSNTPMTMWWVQTYLHIVVKNAIGDVSRKWVMCTIWSWCRASFVKLSKMCVYVKACKC